MPSISVPVESSAATVPPAKVKVRLQDMFRTTDGRNHVFTFILVSTLFALWGFCNGQLEVLNKKFQNSLQVSIAWSTLVQSVTFIGYAIMAIPAGKLTRRFGYKGGIIIGLSLVAGGALWFYPATHIATYPVFLLGLFVIACGLACLETVANPYTTVLGPPQAAHTRINLAQSANGFGVMLGPIVGGSFLLSATGVADTSIDNLYKPYFVIAGVVVLLAIAFAASKVPEIEERGVPVAAGTSLWGRRHLVFAVVAQFFYVGAQIAVWSLFVNYMVAETPAMSQSLASVFPSGWTYEKAGAYHVTEGGAANFLGFGGYGLFFLGRLVGTGVVRNLGPQRTLAFYATINALLMGAIVLRIGWLSVGALFLSFFFMSIMFPTIFSLGIHGLGEHTKRGSAYIVMAIGGGGVFPFLNGWISQHVNMAAGFVVPLVCFAVVLWYAMSWERLERASRGA
jgi:FHS family L-fucose permease-like MFS transporter